MIKFEWKPSQISLHLVRMAMLFPIVTLSFLISILCSPQSPSLPHMLFGVENKLYVV